MIALKRTLIALLLLSSFTIYADAGGVDEDVDPDPAPIDTSISILLVSGLILGAVLITKNKKVKNL